MELMGQRDMRHFIQLFDGERGALALRTLKSFLKGVQVTVPPNERRVKIEDIVLHAGYFEFEKGTEKTRVMVRHIRFYRARGAVH